MDDLIMQLVGLRYTEPDLTISYPGFLYLLMKLESMIRKRGRWGKSQRGIGHLKKKAHQCTICRMQRNGILDSWIVEACATKMKR